MILFLKPVFFDKVWGGKKISDFLNQPTRNSCGECWGISAHENGESIIENGIHKGKTLKFLFENNKDLFGNYEGNEFPILVKVIDAKESLSIQVHPDNNYAKKYNSFGKDECWYIIDADPNAHIVIGNNFKTKDELIEKIYDNDFINYLHRTSVTKGDYFYIKSGTLHSICAGTFLLEIQQSSDIAFRIFDFNRLDKGKLRKLHIKEALDVIKVPDDVIIKTHINKYFEFEIINNKDNTLYTSHIHGDYLAVLDGNGKINEYDIRKGDFLMVSSNSDYELLGNLTFQKTNF